MNKVSIIIPVYNSEKYIERCLDSILKQTYKNIEIIAIDDGSKDQSLKKLKKYQKNSDNIKIYSRPNKGISATRNEAIDYATGEYIMFIDNDDYIDEDYVKKFIDIAIENKSDVVVGGYRRVNSKNKIIKEVSLKQEKWSSYMVVAPWAKIYKKSYITKNKITFLNTNIGEDIYFTLPAVSLTSNIKIISYVGYNWFYNDESVSNTIHKKISKELQFEFLLDSLYKRAKKDNLLNDEYIEYYFVKTIIWFLFYTCKGTDTEKLVEAKEYYFNWLQKHFPNYKKNKEITLFKPKGEKIYNKVLVFLFVKTRLSTLLLKIYKR